MRRPITPRALVSCAVVLALGSEASGADPAPAPAAPDRKREIGIVPLVGGDTDIGFGVGQLSTVAALSPEHKPYRWAVESAAFITFKPGVESGDTYIIPYQDYFFQWTVPQLAGKRLRLEIRPSYTKETTQRYYGLGNASPAPADDVPSRDFYARTHPTLIVKARYRILEHVHVGIGGYYTHNWLEIPITGTLWQQMAAGDATVRGLLGQSSTHGVALFETLMHYDSRDSEIAPETGQFHQLKLRISPAINDVIPYAYQQVNVTSRFYVTIIPDRLVLAGRALIDVQFGNPPFYELARFEDTFALGGGYGVRGVPAQRYYGKVKVLSNWEVRSQIFQFTLRKKLWTGGIAVFFDAGRAWAELARHPELDGTGWGIKYGVGGGLRLQLGKTFVVRGDVAWSPDARPIGGYVAAGHMF